MKKSLVLVITIIFTFLSYSSHAQTSAPDKEAVAMLKKFYTAYMTELAGSSDPKICERKLSLLKNTYCTKAFLNKIPKLADQTDADPVVKAQDSSAECVKTLTIKPDQTKPSLYIARYTDGYSTVVIHISVVKQNGSYLIDNAW